MSRPLAGTRVSRLQEQVGVACRAQQCVLDTSSLVYECFVVSSGPRAAVVVVEKRAALRLCSAARSHSTLPNPA